MLFDIPFDEAIHCAVIAETLTCFGKVLSVCVMTKRGTGKSKGCGYAPFQAAKTWALPHVAHSCSGLMWRMLADLLPLLILPRLKRRFRPVLPKVPQAYD